jgi:medium-chain acyl-[acyl-carrier-protein] hydrolase
VPAHLANWIAVPKPNPSARIRLFCFPYAGGGATIYFAWANALWPTVEVCPIQLPGRESRIHEPVLARMTYLVDALAGAIRSYIECPFAFFGHSMGGLIAFELARRLMRDGQPGPSHLFVSASRAPQLIDNKQFLHTEPDSIFIERFSKKYAPLPKMITDDPEMTRLFLPILRADIAVCETYKYFEGGPLDCPISVVGGWQDNQVSRADLEAWNIHTTAGFSLRMFAGDHFFLKSAQAQLLHAVREVLTHMTRHIS